VKRDSVSDATWGISVQCLNCKKLLVAVKFFDYRNLTKNCDVNHMLAKCLTKFKSKSV